MIKKGAADRTSHRDGKDMTSASSRKKEARRRAVARTAFELFLEQGYEKTTMRQIAYRAKILNGSLYNLFASKDEIFEHIMMKAIDNRQSACIELIEDEKDYLYALALPFVVELYACGLTPKLAELFHEAYGNWHTFDRITDIDIGWVTDVSERFGLALDQVHIKQNIVAVNACISKFVDRSLFTEGTNVQEDARTMLIVMFTLLNLPLHGVDNLLQRFGDLLSTPETWERFRIWAEFGE